MWPFLHLAWSLTKSIMKGESLYSCNSTPYITKPLTTVTSSVTETSHRHQLRLLAVAPLPALDPDSSDEESASANAEAHVNFFVETLKFYDLDFKGWAVCHCADSASVNIKIAKITHGRHGPCSNRNLALAGEKMLEDDDELREVVEKCEKVGAHVQNSAKVQTTIRNLASAVDYKMGNIIAKSSSATRKWLRAAIILHKHLKLSSYYCQLMTDKVGKMRDHQSTVDMSFIDCVKEKRKFLIPIRGCSEYLQTHGLMLKDTQGALDFLRKNISDQKGVPGKLIDIDQRRLNYILIIPLDKY